MKELEDILRGKILEIESKILEGCDADYYDGEIDGIIIALKSIRELEA